MTSSTLANSPSTGRGLTNEERYALAKMRAFAQQVWTLARKVGLRSSHELEDVWATEGPNEGTEAPGSRVTRVYISAADLGSENFICMSVYVDRKLCESDDSTYEQCRCRKALLSGNSGLSAPITYY